MQSEVSICFGPLYEAHFLERPNRFLIRCRLVKDASHLDGEGADQLVEAHLADPGRLRELLIPGCRIWLRKVDSPLRKTKWSTVLCEVPEGKGLVSLDSTLPNRLIARALKSGLLEEFSRWTLRRAEFQMGNSRWDFLLTKGDLQLALEVKSVTLVENGIALFPDAVTARGAKHVKELAALAADKGWEAAVLFVVQREDVEKVQAAETIDPNFAAALAEAEAEGVRILGRKCRVTLDGIVLGDPIPVG